MPCSLILYSCLSLTKSEMMMDVLPCLLFAVYSVLLEYTHEIPGDRDATDFAGLFL